MEVTAGKNRHRAGSLRQLKPQGPGVEADGALHVLDLVANHRRRGARREDRGLPAGWLRHRRTSVESLRYDSKVLLGPDALQGGLEQMKNCDACLASAPSGR